MESDGGAGALGLYIESFEGTRGGGWVSKASSSIAAWMARLTCADMDVRPDTLDCDDDDDNEDTAVAGYTEPETGRS